HVGYDPIASGSHTKHLDYAFNMTTTAQTARCTICHKWNESASYSECTQCHLSSGEKTYHVNGKVDVLFDMNWGTGVYNDTTLTPGKPGNGYFSCDNTYCHSRGTGWTSQTGDNRAIEANTSRAWGSTTACNSCHGIEPGSTLGRPWYTGGTIKANSHRRPDHLVTCNICHYETTTDGTSIDPSTGLQTHVNRRYNLSPAPGTSFSYTYSVTGGSCANVWGTPTGCHNGSTYSWGS
ncbi:MAG: CxxxxCH/CxxCH domain-containing protein, partial [Nitrospirae bacterium]|nr:CxxxxCH/CxxCH domain-containing protein [Nitrospirota bacterium]